MITRNPEEASEIVKMSKDSSTCTSGEHERRNKLFKIFNIKFSGKVDDSEEGKKVNGNGGNSSNIFTNLFDRKTPSLFSKKNFKANFSSTTASDEQ